MKSVLSLTTLLIATFFSSLTAQAETAAAPLDGKSAGTAAELFLAGYIKSIDGKKPLDSNTAWVAMSDKELEVDPVIFAQDVPITPFKAESSKVKGDTATVVVSGKYNEKEFSKLKVTLVAKDGRWLVSKIARAN